MMQTTQDKSVNEMLQRQEEREQKLREKHKERELAAQAAADALVAEDLAKKEKLRRKAQLNGVAAKEQVRIVNLSVFVFLYLFVSPLVPWSEPWEKYDLAYTHPHVHRRRKRS